ncbi:amidohydrolase [Crocinitomix catalasitica]|uniref:amidohydrolase n=1 Tax=Crocinitomix catalasitica TaxID=184607 RepID=UPI000489415A|nr:amidohydrolase [Crocinitomix catalasitica]
MKIIYFGLILSLFVGCYKSDTADLIIHNAKIYSCDENFTIYDAMAIRDGKIIQLGPEREILNGYKCDNIIDAKLRPVYPGFHDGHCHFLGYAQGFAEVDLRGSKSFDEVLNKIAIYQSKNERPWIIGRGWDQSLWANDSFPTNAMLNELYPEIPVLIRRVDGHAAIANQKALDIAGIDTTTQIPGGLIEKVNGQLTGLLLDNAYDVVMKQVPVLTESEKLAVLQKAEQQLFQVGLTSINDAGIDAIDRDLFIEWYSNNALSIRDYAMLFPDDDNINYASKEGKYKTNNLAIRSFKLIADGSLGSRGACLIHPYSDQPNQHGFLLRDYIEIRDLAELAAEIGYQVNTHAIGDSANRVMLNIYTETVQKIADHRWKIEHAQVINPNDFNLFEAIRIIPSVQPTHCTSDMRWAEERLGSERVKYAYAYQTLLKKAGRIVLGTDFPVENIAPLETFYAAVSRQSKDGQPEGGFYPDEKLTRKQALLGMTLWPAYSNFEEDEKGSLSIGKFADFVILTKDIMTIDDSEILSTYVVQTFLNGEEVYNGD